MAPDPESFDASLYMGRRFEDARARAEADGWRVRKLTPAQAAYPLEYRADRVNLLVEGDLVVDVSHG